MADVQLGKLRDGGDRHDIVKREAVAGVRLVRLLDDPKDTGNGRKELMIIYSEDLAPTGKRLSELVSDDKPTPAFAPLQEGLVERAAKAVTVSFR